MKRLIDLSFSFLLGFLLNSIIHNAHIYNVSIFICALTSFIILELERRNLSGLPD